MQSRAGGFSLLEVLIAVLVLALGIVAAGGTQLAALRSRQGSVLLSNGVQLAGALADRMRANAPQTQAGDARNPYLQLRYDAASDGAPPPSAPLCHRERCSSAELAAFDLFEVRQALFVGYPAGRVLVCRDGAAAGGAGAGHALTWACAGGTDAPVVIKIGWHGKRADGSAAQDDAGQFAPVLALVAGGAP
jgi:type IV pilus assembly protein PilV